MAGVDQVAVMGVPDPVFGEEVMAVIVWDKAQGAPPRRPRSSRGRRSGWAGTSTPAPRVRFVDEMPLGPSMKVLKRELRRTIAEAPAADLSG
jgi:long-chain acyl-CoA synthetase